MLTFYHCTGVFKTPRRDSYIPAQTEAPRRINSRMHESDRSQNNVVIKISDNMSPRDKTKSNRKPGRDLNVVFAEKSGENQVFGMATLAEYKTRNIF